MVFDKWSWFFRAALGIGSSITLICLVLSTDYATTYLHFGIGAAALLLWGVYSFCKAVELILAKRGAAASVPAAEE